MAINILDCSISCGKANEYGVYDINNFTVKYKKKTLEFGKDYYSKNSPYISDNFVVSKITVYGMNDYTGETTVEYKTEIILLDINNYNFSINKQTYRGVPFIPEIHTELILDKDFIIIECINNKDIGEGQVLIRGIRKFTGDMTLDFEILPLHLSTCTLVVPEIKNQTLNASDIKVIKDKVELKADEDYDIVLTEEDIQDAKICTIDICGVNNCIGNIKEVVSLNGKYADLNKENITLDSTEFEYTGEEIIPEVESDTLIENVDYNVEVNNNVEIGDGSVVLRGMGAYENSVSTKGFRITAIDIADSTITCGEPVTHILDDGSECDIYDIDNLKVEYNGTILIRNEDYNITIEPSKDLLRMILKSQVNITGKGNYTGSKSQVFYTGILSKEDPIPQNPQYAEQLVPGLPVEIDKAAVYSQFFSRKYNALISGIVYIYSDYIRNNRIQITHQLDGVGVNGCDGGWVSIDDILIKPYKYEIGEKVIVNGNLYQNPDGTGTYIVKDSATMYVVEIKDDAEYTYNYGIASTTYNNKQGWCSENELTKAL